MCKKVLICLSPSISHLLPILQYIREEKSTSQYIFYGFESTKNVVESFGYKYYVSTVHEITELLKYRKQLKIKSTVEVYKKIYSEVTSIIDKNNVEEIWCDISRYTFYGPIGNILNKPTKIFWTYNGPTHFNLKAPPQTSRVLPVPNKIINSFNCLMAWVSHFIKKEILTKKIFFYFFFPYNIIFSARSIAKIRYSMDGWFINTEKIICGPKEFNKFFDEKTTHTGILIDTDRKIGKPWINVNNKENIIYITFGTMNSRYKNILDTYAVILDNLVKIMKQKDIYIIVNIGELDINLFSKYSTFNNIEFVKGVDQLSILSQSSFIIFHGGFGTLKESLFYSVPMIVIPQTYDQFSNAILVTEANLGTCINLATKDSTRMGDIVLESLAN